MRIVRALWAVLSRNVAWKLAALFGSMALWVAVNGSEPNADRYIRLPVRPFGLAKRLVIADHLPGTVEVEVRGPRSILRTIDEEAVRVPLDLRTARPGTMSIKLTPDMLNFPRRVRVVRMEPARIDLRVERLLRKTVPVQAVLVPAQRNGYTISGVTVTPADVEVSGPAGQTEAVQLVQTEPISTLGADGYIERDAPLAPGGEWLTFFPDSVRVRFTIEEVEGKRTFTAMSVVVRGAQGPAVLTPATVAATVRGPQRRLLAFEPQSGAAFVEAGGLGPGAYAVSVQMTLPEGFHVDDVSPATVRLEIGNSLEPDGPDGPAPAHGAAPR
jgi:YbbR domain-containing protein